MRVFQTVAATLFAIAPGAVGICGGYLAAHGPSTDVSGTWIAVAATASLILVVIGLNIAYDIGRADRMDDAAERGSW